MFDLSGGTFFYICCVCFRKVMDGNPKESKSRTPILIVLSGFSGFRKLRFNANGTQYTYWICLDEPQDKYPIKKMFLLYSDAMVVLKGSIVITQAFVYDGGFQSRTISMQ